MADIKMETEDSTNGDDESLKRKNDTEVEDVDSKKMKQENQETNTLKFLAYKDLPYEDQLKKKYEEVEACFKTFHGSFPSQYPELIEWHKSQLLKWFKIEEIRPSPKIEGYRNKCELTIGYNPEFGGKLGAGVRASNFETDRVEINTTDESYIHLPKAMIEVAQEFSTFLEPYNDSTEKCPYVYLYIRSNNKEELMVMVIVIAENDTTEDFKEQRDKVVKFFTEESGMKDQIKSIYLQARPVGCTKKSFELTFTHAWGEDHLVEELMDTTILVTPSLFFNINTYATELIYQNVCELADCRKKKTLVIDLFCGCGVLSMILAKKARQVIAIDPSKWNIRQAKAMAAHNNIKNIQFLIGRPEDALAQAWTNIVQAEEVILICDPPSNSKPRYYIDIIGDMNNLTKLIYLNSNSKSNVVKNLMHLTEAALLPVRVIPIDIAPHTVRLEMVVLCKKFDPYQISRPLDGGPPSLLEGGGHSWESTWGEPHGSWGSGSFSGMGGFGPNLEDIERRAFAMGLAKGSGYGGGGNFYDDFAPGPPMRNFSGYSGGYGNGYGRGPPPMLGRGPPMSGGGFMGAGGWRGGKKSSGGGRGRK